jgi:hypothetical protein
MRDGPRISDSWGYDRHDYDQLGEAPVPIDDDRLIGDAPNPYGPVGSFGGVSVYLKPDLTPGTVELRDRYGVLVGTIRNVGSIAVHGDKKE